MELVIELYDSKDRNWFEDLKRLVDEAGVKDLSLVKIEPPGGFGANERPKVKAVWTDPTTIAALLGVIAKLLTSDIEVHSGKDGLDFKILQHESGPSIEEKVIKHGPIRDRKQSAEVKIRKTRAIPDEVPGDVDPQSSEGVSSEG
jgi:hypothetical protein